MLKRLLVVAAAVSFVPAVAAAQSLEFGLASGSPAAGFVLAAALGLALRLNPR